MSTTLQGPVTGYLINPEARTIAPVEFLGGANHLHDIQKALDCRIITSTSLDDTDGIYCDDEGLLRDDARYFFGVRGRAEPIAGRGLVLGVDAEGYDTAPSITLEALRERVFFIQPYAGGLWDRQWATAPHRHELNSFKGLLQTMQQEAAQ